MTDAAIPAATILLLRDAPAFEVLMIERHADTPFAGGAIVFPGGRIDDHDDDPRWADFCDGVDDAPAEQIPARVAAIREAFEEAGILLARRDGALVGNEVTGRLDHLRGPIEADAAGFLAMIRGEGPRLALDSLHLYARWEPPVRGHHPRRRYHTWFFAATTPADQNAREDGNEATDCFWTTPQGAIDDALAGRRKAIFPTMRNLELLNVSARAEEVFTFAAKRKIDVVMPEIIERDGKYFLTLPDDLGYPITEESLDTAFRG